MKVDISETTAQKRAHCFEVTLKGHGYAAHLNRAHSTPTHLSTPLCVPYDSIAFPLTHSNRDSPYTMTDHRDEDFKVFLCTPFDVLYLSLSGKHSFRSLEKETLKPVVFVLVCSPLFNSLYSLFFVMASILGSCQWSDNTNN
jgi:hypothetical protein